MRITIAKAREALTKSSFLGLTVDGKHPWQVLNDFLDQCEVEEKAEALRRSDMPYGEYPPRS